MQLLIRVTPKPGHDFPILEGLYDLRSCALSLRPVARAAPVAAKSDLPPRSQARAWSTEELEILRHVYPAGGVAECLPLLPGRPKKAVTMQVYRLGLKRADDKSPAVVSPADPVAMPRAAAAPVAPLPLPRAIERQAPQPAVALPPRKLPLPAAPVVAPRGGSGRHPFSAARDFLMSKGMNVKVVDSSDPESGWWVSTYPNPLTAEQVIGIATRKGMA